jgi:hypothetical protein
MVAAQVTVVIPWRYSADRYAALGVVMRYLRGHFAQAGMELDLRRGPIFGDEPWCKAEAVRRGLEIRPPGDVLVVHDADVVAADLVPAVRAVLDGAPWAMPHGNVLRLTREASGCAMAHQELLTEPSALPLAERPYRGVAGGGVVALPPSAYEAAPLDPRFVGWGQEDTSWARALRTVVGEPVRLSGPLWHLWHAPQPRASRRVGSEASAALEQRYRWANNDRGAMSLLLDEARCAAWVR